MSKHTYSDSRFSEVPLRGRYFQVLPDHGSLAHPFLGSISSAGSFPEFLLVIEPNTSSTLISFKLYFKANLARLNNGSFLLYWSAKLWLYFDVFLRYGATLFLLCLGRVLYDSKRSIRKRDCNETSELNLLSWSGCGKRQFLFLSSWYVLHVVQPQGPSWTIQTFSRMISGCCICPG